MQDNYEKIKEDINQEMQRRREEDKKNKKIIQQLKIIEKLEIDLYKAKSKLEKLTSNEYEKETSKDRLDKKEQSDG